MSLAEGSVYLDYAASTPVDPRVARRIAECLGASGSFANPASTGHAPGRAARALVEAARAEVALLAGCEPAEIVWTSGATESDNLAILGAARFHASRGRHVVTARTEHKAVLDACRQLGREGFDVTYLRPDRGGLIAPEQVSEALRDDTVLVSIMHVNNEIGVVQDIAGIGALCRERGVLFHVDAAQSVGRVPLDLGSLPVDLLALSAHKVYGPKGIGALYVRRRPRALISPLVHGGGQEAGLRPGTLPTHQIVGMGEAFRVARLDHDEDDARIGRLGARLRDGLGALDGIHFNGDTDHRVAGILNVSIEGVEGESLLVALRGLAVSSGSACTSQTQEPSYVLRALGRDEQLAQASIRFSLGRFTTPVEIDAAVDLVREQVPRLRALMPA